GVELGRLVHVIEETSRHAGHAVGFLTVPTCAVRHELACGFSCEGRSTPMSLPLKRRPASGRANGSCANGMLWRPETRSSTSAAGPVRHSSVGIDSPRSRYPAAEGDDARLIAVVPEVGDAC